MYTNEALFCVVELVGYGARIWSVKHAEEKDPFAVSFVLIIMAPVVIAGAIYVLFGRIVFYVTPRELQTFRFLWTSPRWLTVIFVFCDLCKFILSPSSSLLRALTLRY